MTSFNNTKSIDTIDAMVGRRGFLRGGAAAVGLAALAGFGGPAAHRALGTNSTAAVRTAATTTGRFGLDISINGETMTLAQKYGQVAGAYGGGLGAHMKFFDGGAGWGAANRSMTAMGWGRAAGEVKPVFCAKRHVDADFNQLMTDRAAGRLIFVCYWQEVNDDIRDGHLSVESYRATWVQMNTLRRAHPNGANVRFVPIMNAYVVEDQGAAALAGGYDTLSLLTGLPIDTVGYDLYDDSWMPGTWSAAAHLDPAAAAARTLGKKWCIPEFGVQRSTKTVGDTDSSAADRLTQVIDYCRADPTFNWLNYWEGKGANGDWTLIGKPGQAVMSAALVS